MTIFETFYYAEAEGLLPTRAGKINAVINDIKKYPYSEVSFLTFNEILNNHGLTYEDLSEKEKKYINARIA